MVELKETETGLAWIYAIVFLFILGITHMVIFPSINSRVIPALEAGTTLTGAEFTEYSNNIHRVMTYLRITTYILVFVTFIYMVLSVFRREQRDYYV